MSSAHPYDALTPDLVLDAVESTGRLSDMRMLALNSYENRVFQVGIEDDTPVIAKFYRPERWSAAAIQEEHDFTQALADAEISVVAPLRDDAGRSLFEHAGFRFALYPRRGGHAPNLDDPDTLFSLGRTLGRIHAIGRAANFQYRPTVDVASLGRDSWEFLQNGDFLPAHLATEFAEAVEALLARCDQRFAETNYQPLRLHGDCHPGNILWRDDTAHFVDFDDARTGPAVQDFWMLLADDRHEQARQMMELIEGYEEFCDFNRGELKLIEPLRGLRQLYYSAWLARRWEDPAFPRHFPWFNSPHYWQQQLLQLRDQIHAIDNAPLSLY